MSNKNLILEFTQKNNGEYFGKINIKDNDNKNFKMHVSVDNIGTKKGLTRIFENNELKYEYYISEKKYLLSLKNILVLKRFFGSLKNIQ